MGLFDRFRKSGQPDASSPSPSGSSRTKTPEWVTDESWREWGAPLDIVVGESHYDRALRRIAGPPRVDGWFVLCEAKLQREPRNEYDEDAIAVLIGGEKVGHISADACSELTPSMDKHGGNARMTGVPTLVRGGWTTAPNFGVMLWLQVDEIRAAMPDVDWKSLVDEFESSHWLPADTGVNTGHGRAESQVPKWTGEPRMPPLTTHYSAYVDDVKELKRAKRLTDAETLLLALLDAVEEESRTKHVGVAPWYYEQLAIIRRKLGDLDGEVAVLERFAAQTHAPGAATPIVLERLEDARERQSKGHP